MFSKFQLSKNSVMVLPKFVSILSVAVFFAQATSGQFVSQPPASAFTNATGHAGVPVRYKEVPTGICELDPNVKS